MAAHSILVGKSYRTPGDEIREVKSIADEEVTYRFMSAPHGPGMIGRSAERRTALASFAAEVESEVSTSGS